MPEEGRKPIPMPIPYRGEVVKMHITYPDGSHKDVMMSEAEASRLLENGEIIGYGGGWARRESKTIEPILPEPIEPIDDIEPIEPPETGKIEPIPSPWEEPPRLIPEPPPHALFPGGPPRKIFIHLSDRPTIAQIRDMERLGVKVDVKSWMPPVGAHPTGFVYAEMDSDVRAELLALGYIDRVDSAERELEPQIAKDPESFIDEEDIETPPISVPKSKKVVTTLVGGSPQVMLPTFAKPSPKPRGPRRTVRGGGKHISHLVTGSRRRQED